MTISVGQTGKIIFCYSDGTEHFRLNGTVREIHQGVFFVRQKQIIQATGFYFSNVCFQGKHEILGGGDTYFVFD